MQAPHPPSPQPSLLPVNPTNNTIRKLNDSEFYKDITRFAVEMNIGLSSGLIVSVDTETTSDCSPKHTIFLPKHKKQVGSDCAI